MIELAHKGGLFNGCDVKQLIPYWKNKRAILDVGTCFGRVIGALIDNGLKSKITSVERNHSLFEYAYAAYKNIEGVELFNQDIHAYLNANKRQKFSVIFILWSGLADYNPHEQAILLKRLAKRLEKNGYLILDTMPMNVMPLDTEKFEQQSFLTRSKNNSIVRTYEASYDEVCQYAENAKLQLLKRIECPTDTQRMRWLYILEKP